MPKLKKEVLACVLAALFVSNSPIALAGLGSGWVQVGYLTQILSENYRRYKQLKSMVKDAHEQKTFLRAIHKGIENTTGLLESLPIRDNNVLSGLRTFSSSLDAVSKLYGKIPKSKEQAIQLIHDKSVAESLNMIGGFKQFAEKQELNSETIQAQAREASPKGAARMAAESNAQILMAVTQLIRLESQNLKMQSEILAMKNRREKQSVSSFQKLSGDFKSAFSGFRPTKGIPRL